MNLAEMFGDASKKIARAIKYGLLVQDKSHRQNPHRRMQTKNYADKRQKGGRAYFLKNYGGSNFVSPKPSEKTLQRRKGLIGPTPGTKAWKRWKNAAKMGKPGT